MVHGESVMMLGRDDQIPHACRFRQAHPIIGIELDRVHAMRHLAILCDRDVESLHDPLRL